YLTSSLEKELVRLRKIIFQGKYAEAMDGIEEVLATENISSETKVRALNLKSHIEFNFGNFVYQPDRIKTALALALEAYEESLKIDNPSLLFTAIMFLLWSYYKLSMFKEGLELPKKLDSIYERICSEDPREAKRLEPTYLIIKAVKPAIRSFLGEPVPENYIEESIKQTEKALKLAEEINEPFAKAEAMNNLIVFYIRTGRMDKHYEHIIKLLDFYEEFGNKYGKAYAFGGLGYYHYSKGEYEQYLDYMTKRLRIWEELENNTGIAFHNFEMGTYYESQRRYDKALECFNEALDYFTEKEDSRRISFISQNIGYVYRMKGELRKALEYTKKAYTICNETKFETWWDILPRLAAIHLLIGNIDKALHFEEECLDLHENTGYTLETALSLSRISMIYWQKGAQEQAILEAQKSLKLLEETENYLWIGNVLSDLIFFTAERSEIEAANDYLKQLEQIIDNTKDRVLKQRFNFSEAIILSHSGKDRDRMKGTLLYENLLREELDYAFHVQILLSLSELLIIDLRKTGDKEILTKLQKYILELYSLATKNNSYLLTVETLLLQSKLALVELDIKKAQQLLEQANKIADDKSLERLKTIIAQEKESFHNEKEILQKFDKEDPLDKKIEVINFEKRINSLKKVSSTLKQSGEHVMLKSML
ncbi:MAG: tetratricopeptide repeat protein, partial [Candidatus Heimdallarchaeota archaeon]